MKEISWIVVLLALSNITLGQDIEMPYFKGCENYPNFSEEKRACSNEKLITFVSENLRYPKAALEEEIEGTVYVNFKINQQGQIHSAKALNEIGGQCEEEALRVVNIMPIWEAAQSQNGKEEVELNLPIFFALQNAQLYSEQHTIAWGTLVKDKVSVNDIKSNIASKIVVRDELGNDYEISNLSIAYQKGQTFLESESRGVITNDMRKLLKKIKGGGKLLITTTILADGDFVEVARLFNLI